MFQSVIFVLSAVSAVGVVTYCVIRWAKYRNSDSWPVVEGHVESYGRYRHLDNDGSSSLSFVDVSYSYSVDGEFYSGEWLSPTLKNDKALTEFLEQSMPIGKAVSIRYMPSHPERSLLADGPQPERSDAPISLGL